MAMFILGLLCIAGSFCILYLKYRVVLTGKKYKAKITGIANQDCLYTAGSATVKKRSYIVRIKNTNYFTAHGCLFVSQGRKKIGKEILVFKSEKYGKEVFKCFDFRIEVLAALLVLLAVLCFVHG